MHSWHKTVTKTYVAIIWEKQYLTFTTLWANSADDKLIIILLFPPPPPPHTHTHTQNRLWHFMQIISLGDNLHEMSKSIFWKKKYFKMLSAEFLPSMLNIKLK